MPLASNIPAAPLLRIGLADAERESRAEAIGLMLDCIESAQSAAEAALMDCEREGDGNTIADVLVALQNARDAAEGMLPHGWGGVGQVLVGDELRADEG